MYRKTIKSFDKSIKNRGKIWSSTKKMINFLKKVCRIKFLLYLCTRNTATGCSAVRLAHLVWDQRVPGSNPGTPTKRNEKSFLFFCHGTRIRGLTEKNVCVVLQKQKDADKSTSHCFVLFLRKERDSNPRYSCPYTAFRVRPDRPLRHLSNAFCGCKGRNLFFNSNYF